MMLYVLRYIEQEEQNIVGVFSTKELAISMIPAPIEQLHYSQDGYRSYDGAEWDIITCPLDIVRPIINPNDSMAIWN